MKIAIVAEGGGKIGLGHISRCRTLAAELIRAGCEVMFFLDEVAAAAVPGTAHIARPCGLSKNAAVDETLAVIKNWGADAVITDSYIAQHHWYASVYEAFCSVVIDDNVRLACRAEYVVNGNVYAPQLDYSGFDAKLLLGGQYTPLRGEFAAAPPVQIREKADTILVTMGGSDPNSATPGIIRAFEGKGVKLRVIEGPLFTCGEDIRKAAALCDCEIIKNPSSMLSEMSRCDMAITAAGSTTYELCAVGLPVMLSLQADNQINIYEYFAVEGRLSTAAGADFKETDAAQAMALLEDYDRRLAMQKYMLGAVSRTGAANIAGEIVTGETGDERREASGGQLS